MGACVFKCISVHSYCVHYVSHFIVHFHMPQKNIFLMIDGVSNNVVSCCEGQICFCNACHKKDWYTSTHSYDRKMQENIMCGEDGVLSTTKFTLSNKYALCQALSLSDSLLQTVHLINYLDMPAAPIN